MRFSVSVLFGFRSLRLLHPYLSTRPKNIHSSYHLCIYFLFLFCTSLLNRPDPIRASPSKKPRQAVSPLHHVHDATPDVTAEDVEHLLKRFKEHGWESQTKANWTFPRRDKDKPRNMRRLLAAMEKEFVMKIAKTTPEPSEKKSTPLKFTPYVPVFSP